MKKKTLPGKRVRSGRASVSQNSANQVNTSEELLYPFLAEVTKSHSDRMTCDIKASNGIPSFNVPVLTSGGLIDDKVWGEKLLPQIGDYVIVMFLEGRVEKKVILGTFLPFLNSLFATQQVAVDSTGKSNSLKLIKDEDTKTVRKIYPGGVTEEYTADGTLTIETPQGGKVVINTANSDIEVEAGTGGNVVVKGGTVTVEASTLLKLKSGDATLWSPNILGNCLFTGAPHGGSVAGILKLKGG